MKLLVLTFLFCAVLSVGCGSMTSPVSVQAEGPRANPSPTPIADENIISIAAVGDIMLASPYPDDTRMPPKDGAGMLDAVAPILSAADIAFGNMEGPIVDSGTSAKCKPKEPL